MSIEVFAQRCWQSDRKSALWQEGWLVSLGPTSQLMVVLDRMTSVRLLMNACMHKHLHSFNSQQWPDIMQQTWRPILTWEFQASILDYFMQNPVPNEVFITFYLAAADLTCGVMYWILGTGDVYVYFGDTNPVISYWGFSDSFAIKLPVLLSIGLALIRA